MKIDIWGGGGDIEVGGWGAEEAGEARVLQEAQRKGGRKNSERCGDYSRAFCAEEIFEARKTWRCQKFAGKVT